MDPQGNMPSGNKGNCLATQCPKTNIVVSVTLYSFIGQERKKRVYSGMGMTLMEELNAKIGTDQDTCKMVYN